MQIEGKEIPDAAIAGARVWCASQTDGFTAAQLQNHAIGLGVAPACAMRFADRLIQLLKKNGAIRLDGKPRRWFPTAGT